MKINHLTRLCRYSGIVISFFFFASMPVCAANPLWTFTPLTATALSVPSNRSGIVQYRITNQSRQSHALLMLPITGITQTTTAGNCPNPFTLSYKQSCVLCLEINGSQLQKNILGGPMVCQRNADGSSNPMQCYQPSPSDNLNIALAPPVVPPPPPPPPPPVVSPTVLSVSVSTLVLSVNNLNLNPALTGKSRKITLTNIGNNIAYAVNYSVSSALPSGSLISPTSCGNMAPGDSCVLTITPGSTPSAAAGDMNPAPITITMSGENTNTLTSTIQILTYGSIYQSGYVFAIDDTTIDTSNISGKVLALTDPPSLSSSVSWSSTQDYVMGINENSINPPDMCNGNKEGSCNTKQIVNFYSSIIGSSSAAAYCYHYNAGGYTDWYLPAICEMGKNDLNNVSNCDSISPALQNIQDNLVSNGNIAHLAGLLYWSSTQFSGNSTQTVYAENFELTSDTQNLLNKTGNQLLVRCVRTIT
jgi:hypothetical protein